MAEAPNPKLAAANEALKKRMATAILVEKQVFAGGRLGRFVLKPDQGERWWYHAGQFTTLGLDTPTGFTPRAYSIASSPLDLGTLEFYIALVEGGALTPTIFAQEPGATFRYLSPKGKFTLTQAAKRVLVMVATGTGLAPFISQLRTLWKLHLAGVPNRYRVILFHGVAHGDEFGYGQELEQYAAVPEFGLTYIRSCSRPDPTKGWHPGIAKGRVNEVIRHILGQPIPEGRSVAMPAGIDRDLILREMIPSETAFLICGNPGMIEDLKAPIHAIGVDTHLVEEFWKV